MTDPIPILSRIVSDGWLVGGAVRDRLLGRDTADFDVAMSGPVGDAARALGREAGGYAFELSEAFGAWRVVAHDRSWQVDLLPVDGDSIEEDLSHRDFTINAIAAPLARASAPRLAEVAPERVFVELRRVMAADGVLDGLRLMDVVGAIEAVLPELAALRGVEQSRFHHLDVFEHTLAVVEETVALERRPDRLAGDRAGALQAFMSRPLANELTRAQALRFGALLHDIAKPRTRDVTPQGRVTFIGHDASGAELSAAILARLRASDRLREHVAALARHHLRLGFLVHETPLSRRAVYDYLRVTSPVAVDVTVLSVADRLATRGDNSERAIERHLELAGQMLTEALAWEADPPRPPIRGDDLARALGIRPGPLVGGLLAELEAESFSGEVAGREEAIARARQLIEQNGG